jgi:thioredoxin reductase
MTTIFGADQPFDAAVVGGNFAGLQAALYLLRGRRRVVLFDDGLNRNRFARHSHGFLGQDGQSPEAIRQTAIAQLQAYPGFSFVTARVTAITQGAEFRLDWEGGTGLARRVILATGQRDILPDVPGLAACWGITANQCPYCHGYELADLPTAIILGGHPHAGHYLRQIRRWAGRLTVFDNGVDLLPETREVVADLDLALVSGRIAKVAHESGHVRALHVEGAAPVPVEAVYLGSTTEPAAPLAEALGCAFLAGPAGRHVETDRWQRTTVAGVFAAGDLASPTPAAIFAAAAGATAGLGCDMDLAGLLPG